MAIVKRYTETRVTFPGMPTPVMIARAARDRVYLCFTQTGGNTTVNVSTFANINSTDNMPIAFGTGSIPRWELDVDRHGPLVWAEWWGLSLGLVGGVGLVVLEVFAEETGVRRSPGGVILGPDGSLLNGGGNGPGNAADRLRLAIEAADRLIPDAQG